MDDQISFRNPKRAPGPQIELPALLPIGSPQKKALKDALHPRKRHGGQERVRLRKLERPFYENTPIHLVLNSKRAKRDWSMQHRKHRSKITSMIYVYAKRFQVRVYCASNEGEQLHLLVKAHERKHLADFLRVLAGRIAVTVTGAKRGVKRVGRFWDYLTWSRLVNWGQDFFQVRMVIQEHQIKKGPAPSPDGPSLFELTTVGWNPTDARGS